MPVLAFFCAALFHHETYLKHFFIFYKKILYRFNPLKFLYVCFYILYMEKIQISQIYIYTCLLHTPLISLSQMFLHLFLIFCFFLGILPLILHFVPYPRRFKSIDLIIRLPGSPAFSVLARGRLH